MVILASSQYIQSVIFSWFVQHFHFSSFSCWLFVRNHQSKD